MKYLIVLFFIICQQESFGQKINWQDSKRWKIYRLRGHGLFSYTRDTLIHFKNYSLNEDSMKNFMLGVKVVNTDSTPVWMGAYVGSCLLNGTIVKMEISTYGGFFYCELDRQIYQLPAILKTEWQDYIAKCFNTLYP